MSVSSRSFKQQAHDLIDNLPEDATWPDLIDSAAELQDLVESGYYGDFGSGRVDEYILEEYDSLQNEADRQREDEDEDAAA